MDELCSPMISTWPCQPVLPSAIFFLTCPNPSPYPLKMMKLTRFTLKALVFSCVAVVAGSSPLRAQRWTRVTPHSREAADQVLGPAPTRYSTTVRSMLNRFRGTSSFESDAQSAGGGHWSISGSGRGTLYAWFNFTRAGDSTGVYTLHFQQTAQQWQYLQDTELNLILQDGSRLALGRAARNGTINTAGGVSVTEALAIPVSINDAVRIVRSGHVQGELGHTQFELADKPIQGIDGVIRLSLCDSTLVSEPQTRSR
jgi:hypothetical protein